MNHLSEDDLILLHYAEPGVAEDSRRHLADCTECRGAAEALALTLRACDELPVPAPPAGFERDVWARLAPELKAPERSLGSQPWRVWAAAAAMAVVLTAVFFAGRYSRTPDEPVMTGLSDQARERILAIAVADHLERVQILLTEIANTNAAGASDFANERTRAEDLVQEGRLMRQTLAVHGENATTGFLDEVERFLIETAHTPDGPNAEEIRGLRDRMSSGSLLFKVRVVESNLRNEEQKL